MILTGTGIIDSPRKEEYLLDLYPNSQVALSLRKLSSTYSGNCIRVRRNSDNAEQDIGFSNGTIDSASIDSFCFGTFGYVTTWYDQSGNGRNAISNVSTEQPSIYLGEILTLNGKPAVSFGGFEIMRTGPFAGGPNDSTFLVCRAGIDDVIIDGDTTNNISYWTTFAPGNFRVYAGIVDIAAGIFSVDQQHLVTSIIDGTTSTIRVDTVQVTKNVGTNIRNGLTLGGLGGGSPFSPLTGYIQEIVNYGTNQSSSTSGIQNNINSYYGIY